MLINIASSIDLPIPPSVPVYTSPSIHSYSPSDRIFIPVSRPLWHHLGVLPTIHSTQSPRSVTARLAELALLAIGVETTRIIEKLPSAGVLAQNNFDLDHL